uniref:Protein farnesyltransferase subunit beta n=1 Tax=Poecilia latipinna TaxID=48699 RepID=A0A3B3TWD9_9TELE
RPSIHSFTSPICPSIHSPVQSVHPSIHQSNLSIHSFTNPICPSIHSPIQSVHPFIHQSNLSIHPFTNPICPSIHPSIYQSNLSIHPLTNPILSFIHQSCLDASRPWLCFWILHSLELLEESIPSAITSEVCQFLDLCQSPTGGFAGGPGQHAHLAPTYAAVNALCIIGTEEAYNVINREKLLDFLWSLKQPNGSFVMHIGGEVDVRSAYCAASVASLTNIMTPALFEDTTNWILSCQNWEGGLSGVPGLEAHGGYTFCGTAALVILGKEHMLDLKALLRWVISRQMRFEGGFQGRCNKLVDGCYSFWQAGLLPLLHRALFNDGESELSRQRWMFDQLALQEYILLCCQNPTGGLLDKPGKSRDFYHTCYCLSGLSIAQHFGNVEHYHEVILGTEENRLAPTHPVYNICPDKVAKAVQHFRQLSVPDASRQAGPPADAEPSEPASAAAGPQS